MQEGIIKMEITIPKASNVPRIWNITFISVFITNSLMYVGQQMVQPLITSYAKELGAAEGIIGLIASAFTITSILLKVFSAPAIDTFNRKYLLSGAMCVMGCAFLGFALSYTVPSIFAFRLLQGCGQAFTTSCCLALATDALPKDKLGQGIGIFTLAQAMCQAIGPTIGKFLQSMFGFQTTFFAAAVFMLAGALCAIQIRTDFVRTRQFRISLNSMVAREVMVPAFAQFFLAFAYCLINTFLYIFAEDQGITGSGIGLFFTIYALTLLFTRPLVGRLTDRVGTVKILVPAMCFFGLSFIIISCSTTLWMFYLAAVVSAFGYGACTPVLQALCMKMVTPDRRGAASCTNYLGTDFGFLLGPIVAGVAAGHMGYVSMWRIMLIPIFCAMAVIVLNRKKISGTAGEVYN